MSSVLLQKVCYQIAYYQWIFYIVLSSKFLQEGAGVTGSLL